MRCQPANPKITNSCGEGSRDEPATRPSMAAMPRHRGHAGELTEAYAWQQHGAQQDSATGMRKVAISALVAPAREIMRK